VAREGPKAEKRSKLRKSCEAERHTSGRCKGGAMQSVRGNQESGKGPDRMLILFVCFEASLGSTPIMESNTQLFEPGV